MVAFNKLLNVCVFILAIATLYFAISLKKERKIVVAQRSELAIALNKISDQTDSTVSVKDLEQAQGEEQIVAGVEKVITQKDSLADCVVAMGKTLGIDESKLDSSELKGLDQDIVDSRIELVNTSVDQISTRATAVNKSILSWSESLGAPLNASELRSVDNYEESLSTVGEALVAGQSKVNSYVEELKDSMTKVDQYEWTFSGEEFALNDRFKSAFDSFKSDLEVINRDLASVNDLKDVITAKEDEITELTDSVDFRNEEIRNKEHSIGTLQSLKEKLEDQLKKYTAVAGFDPNVTGSVVSVNAKLGFVVTDLSETDTAAGMKMFIRRGQDFVGSVVVANTDESNSTADIESSVTDIQVGDVVFFKARN